MNNRYICALIVKMKAVITYFYALGKTVFTDIWLFDVSCSRSANFLLQKTILYDKCCGKLIQTWLLQHTYSCVNPYSNWMWKYKLPSMTVFKLPK